MEPQELTDAGAPKALKAVIKAPRNADTCVSPACTRTIDFFLVEEGLAPGVGGRR